MTVAVAAARSSLSGMLKNTGPAGGVAANLRARRVVSGIPAVLPACHVHFVIGPIIIS